MSCIGPNNRPMDQEKYVELGTTHGSTDFSFYLFDDGKVWCFDSPDNGYSRSQWRVLQDWEWDFWRVNRKSIRELVEEKRNKGE